MAATAPPVAQIARKATNLPWLSQSDMLEAAASAPYAVGGIIIQLTAAATLLIGDAVYYSAAFTVNKSATVGNHVLHAGIVVGGVPRGVESSIIEVQQRLTDVGLTAALVNEPVLVCYSGVCYAVSGAAIAVGAQVKMDTGTAGRVITATASTDAGKVLGNAMDVATGAAQTIRIQVSLS